jgi:hypothetical protein
MDFDEIALARSLVFTTMAILALIAGSSLLM